MLCLSLLALAFPILAQTNTVSAPPTNRPAPERFLVIVETSDAMQKRAENVQRCLGQLFASGLHGQLHPGDTIGLWTYNDELHTGGFPLQRWTPQVSRQTTLAIVKFIQQQQYAKESRLAPVMAQLTNVVADSDKITVLLVSDGSEPLVGTPFDGQIAEAFKLNAAEQHQQSMPFVTILRAAKGKFVGCKVNTPPWPVELPAYPVEPTPVAPTPTHATAPPKVEVAPPPRPVTPVVVPEPAPVTVETTNVVPPPTPPPPSIEVPTNPPPAVIATPPPVETNIVPAPVEPTTPPPVSPPDPAPAAQTKAERKTPFIPILIGAGIGLFGIAILCLTLWRRSRQDPRVSLITRSMNKDGE